MGDEAKNEGISEKLTGNPITKLDMWRGQHQVKEMVEEIVAQDPTFAGQDPLKVLNTLLEITDNRMVFTYNKTTYHWGTTEHIRSNKDEPIEVPADGILHGGELKELLIGIDSMEKFIDEYRKNVPWLEYMSPHLIWLLSSPEDYKDPLAYFERRKGEVIKRKDLQVDKVFDGISVRDQKESLSIRSVESRKPYQEGPVIYEVTLSSNGQVHETDSLHRVFLGMENDNAATIYAIQNGGLLGVTKQEMKNALAQNRKEELTKYTNIAIKMFREGYPPVDEMTGLDVDILHDRLKLRDLWVELFKWYESKLGTEDIHMARVVKPALTLVQLEEIQEAYEQKDKKLKRLNHGTGGGGARIVSLVSTLMVLKEKGIRVVKIPLEMPKAIHLYDQTEGEPIQRKRQKTVSYIKAGLIRTIQVFSRMYDVDIVGSDSYYSIDLSTWKPEEVLVGDSKTIKSIATKFQSPE